MSNDRPFPRGWLAKLDALRKDLLAKGFTVKPVPPKRASGPQMGTRWHSVAGQADMVLRDEGLLSEKYCLGCGKRVIAATGELHEGRWCGQCYQVEIDHRAEDRIPPAA